MKYCHTALVVVLALFAIFGPLPGQDKPRENVTVTAVEIPVRVFDGNGYVEGLTKDDFEVYENGVRQAITGFEAVSRSILPEPGDASGAAPQAARSRNFLLIFNVYAYTDQVGEAVDYFFANVFRPGDRLVAMVNEGLVQIKAGGSGKEISDGIKDVLLKVKKERGHELAEIFRSVDKMADSLDRALRGDCMSEYCVGDGDPVASTKLFQDDYQRAWKAYRERRFAVNLGLYKSVADRMGKLDGDKWAVCFQQRIIFPEIKQSGRLAEEMRTAVDSLVGVDPQASMVLTQMREIVRSFDVNADFPAAKLQQIFTQANITFHVLLMKAVGTESRMHSQDLSVREVGAEYEDTLRRISRETGGMSAFSNEVLATLKEAAVKRDQYYLLVYLPEKGLVKPENKIEVRVRREGLDIVSLKTRTAAASGGIAIAGFEVGPRSIAFRLRDYSRPPLRGMGTGRAKVQVTLFDDRSEKVFSKDTTLELVADTVRVSLDFPKLASGNHLVLIEAYDIVSGEKAVLSQAVLFR